MNLCYRYPIIFWNTACLITDSGATDQEDGDSTNYKKTAIAIGKMKQAGIDVEPPNINKSAYTFVPDVDNNKILFGLKGMLNVGDDLIQTIIDMRPYKSIKDFYNRVKPDRRAMVALIKGGAFDEMMDRKAAMVWYLWKTCDKKQRLTLQNMPGLIRYNLIPRETEKEKMAMRVYEFNRYLKQKLAGAGGVYNLNDRALGFLAELGEEALITEDKVIPAKAWDKVYQKWMDVFRNWIAENKEDILDKLNKTIFLQDWQKYAGSANYSAWEMEVLCFYYHEHEMKNINTIKYNIVDFFKQPEEPVVDRSFTKGDKTINLYKLCKIAGTCISKDKTKSTVTLLTTSGVVEVKLRKEQFAIYDRQISQRNPDGTKTVIEPSWFGRGNMIVVQGIRRGDTFLPKKYASTPGHTIYKVDKIDGTDLILRTERMMGEEVFEV